MIIVAIMTEFMATIAGKTGILDRFLLEIGRAEAYAETKVHPMFRAVSYLPTGWQPA